MNKETGQPLTYAQAGVDIDRANRLVESIKTIAKPTQRPGVLTGLGGFGALFEIPVDRYQRPVLVSGTDGVGTKLKLAMALQKHDTIGIDLVAMCVNDIVTLGAEPLFFLDYYATGNLNVAQSEAIMTGIGKGCELAGAALIGGETAEMPGMYHGDDYDLAGFAVGVVEKDRIIDGQKVTPGDALIGLASSGLHSNGFSLVRRILTDIKADYSDPIGDQTLGNILLTPTHIYVKALLTLCEQVDVHAMAHITGGGLYENLPRVLPANTQAVIDSASWEWPEIFHWLQSRGNVATDEMLRTFNVGVGMVICVAQNDVDTALSVLSGASEQAFVIGEIAAAQDDAPSLILKS